MTKTIFSIIKFGFMAVFGIVLTMLAMIGLGHVLNYLIHGENALKLSDASSESDNVLWL